MFYRARFIRAFLFPGEESGKLQKIAKKVFLAPKPPPTIESKFKNRYRTYSRRLGSFATIYFFVHS